MAGPITWRTLLTASPQDAYRPLLAAQASFNGAFDTFNRALEQRQAANQVVTDRSNEAAKQGYLDAIYGAKTVDELTALQSSGQLDTLRQSLTPEALAAVRGADERRLSELRTQLSQAQQFDDAQKARDARPIVDRLTALGNSDDKDVRNSARAALQIYADQGMLPNSGELTSKLVGADRAAVEFGNKQEEHTWRGNEDKRSQTRLEDQLKTSAQQRDASAASIEASREQVKNAQFTRQLKEAEVQQLKAERQLTSILKGTPFEQGTLDTVEGLKTFTDWAEKNIKNQTQRDDIVYNISQLSAESKVPIAVAEAIRAVGGSSENNPLSPLVPGWSRRGDVARNALEARLNSPEYVAMAEGYQQLLANRGGFQRSGDTSPRESEEPAPPLSGGRSAEEAWDAAVAAAGIEKKLAEANARNLPPRPLRLNYRDMLNAK